MPGVKEYSPVWDSAGVMFTGTCSVYNLLLIEAINHSQLQLAWPGAGMAHHPWAGGQAGEHREGPPSLTPEAQKSVPGRRQWNKCSHRGDPGT